MNQCNETSLNPVKILIVPDHYEIRNATIRHMIDSGVVLVTDNASIKYIDMDTSKEFERIASEETKAALQMTPDRFMEMIRPQLDKDVRETMEHNNTALGNIPQDVRERINQEYHRLHQKHPNWKIDRLLRNAGKKFNVQFTFE